MARDDGAVLEALSGVVSLPELEALALLRNPAAAARERELSAVIDAYSQVESLDTVLRRYSSFTTPRMAGPDATGTAGGMGTAPFPFPGVLALKGQVVTQEALAAREELEKARSGLLEYRQAGRSQDGGLARQLANYLYLDRTLDFDASFEARMAKLQPQDVQKALSRHLDWAKLTVVKAGDFAGAQKKAQAPVPAQPAP